MQRYILVFLIISLFFPAVTSVGETSKKIQEVRVLNLPETQTVNGSIAIEGLIKHSFLDRREQIIIPPVPRNNIDNLKRIQSIRTDGFTSVIISLQGEVQSETFSPGTVGAILVPAVGPISKAFQNDGVSLFSMEVPADVTPEIHSYFDSRYFSAESVKKTIGFPEYNIYLYNSTNKSVEVNLYMYLIN